MDFTIYCDGGARGNPGPAASAFVVYDSAGNLVHKESKYLGVATNNIAEYTAVLLGLKWLPENSQATFNLDSELVVNQLTGTFKIKNKKLLELAAEIKNLEKQRRGKINYIHVLRQKNQVADNIVNEKLDEASVRK
jgi:ribonuclease HI